MQEKDLQILLCDCYALYVTNVFGQTCLNKLVQQQFVIILFHSVHSEYDIIGAQRNTSLKYMREIDKRDWIVNILCCYTVSFWYVLYWLKIIYNETPLSMLLCVLFSRVNYNNFIWLPQFTIITLGIERLTFSDSVDPDRRHRI